MSRENAWERGVPGRADWQGRGGCVLIQWERGGQYERRNGGQIIQSPRDHCYPADTYLDPEIRVQKGSYCTVCSSKHWR